MKGIADGAAAAGARFEGRPLDLVDIVAINSDIEIEFLDAALEATADRPRGPKVFARARGAPPARPARRSTAAPSPRPARPRPTARSSSATSRCSTSPSCRYFNVWLDVKPAKGHRVLMQTYPGGIQSGMDYY